MRLMGILAVVIGGCLVSSLFANDEEIASLNRQLDAKVLSERTTAARMLGEIGPAAAVAVPSLIKCLEDHDSGLRFEAVVALGRINADAKHVVPALRPILMDQMPILRHSAVDALRQFGSDAQAAIPALLKLLHDKEDLIRVCAARAIVEIELGKGPNVPQATSVLIAGLKNENHDISSEAIHGLAVVGPAAVSGIQDFVDGSDSCCAANACDALAAIGPGSGPAIDRLVKTASSSDVQLRCHAIHALGQIGPVADKAVPVLIGSLSAADMTVRFGAQQALLGIGKPAVPALTDSLKTPALQLVAAHILAGIGPDASPAVQELTKLLESKDTDVGREAILALAAIGSDAKSASPTLLRLFADKQFRNRPAVAFAFGKLGIKDAVPMLKDVVNDQDHAVLRLAAIWALLQLDPANDEYVALGVPVLTTSLKAQGPEVRREAAAALGRIGFRARSAVPALMALLKDDSVEVRRESLIALAEIGPDSAPAVVEILQILDMGASPLRPIACYALGRIGPAAKDSLPQLQRLLSSHDAHEKTVAAWALVNISPDPETVKVTIPLLVAALKGAEKSTVRVEVARTLGRIGKHSNIVKDALNLAQKDPDEAVRAAATDAMKSLN